MVKKKIFSLQGVSTISSDIKEIVLNHTELSVSGMERNRSDHFQKWSVATANNEYSNGNRRPIRSECWNAAMAIWHNQNIVLLQALNLCHPQLRGDINTILPCKIF